MVVDKVDETYTKEEGRQRGAYIKQRAAAIPLVRVGQPEDVSGVVSFLAGPDSQFMTGMLLLAIPRALRADADACRPSYHRRLRYSFRLRTRRAFHRPYTLTDRLEYRGTCSLYYLHLNVEYTSTMYSTLSTCPHFWKPA